MWDLPHTFLFPDLYLYIKQLLSNLSYNTSGGELSESTTKRVIIIVLVMVCVLPLLAAPEAHMGTEYALQFLQMMQMDTLVTTAARAAAYDQMKSDLRNANGEVYLAYLDLQRAGVSELFLQDAVSGCFWEAGGAWLVLFLCVAFCCSSLVLTLHPLHPFHPLYPPHTPYSPTSFTFLRPPRLPAPCSPPQNKLANTRKVAQFDVALSAVGLCMCIYIYLCIYVSVYISIYVYILVFRLHSAQTLYAFPCFFKPHTTPTQNHSPILTLILYILYQYYATDEQWCPLLRQEHLQPPSAGIRLG